MRTIKLSSLKIATALGLASLLMTATASTSGRAEQREPLPTLAIDINETSLSGISSGAYMAGQFQFAHSRLVKGVAIIAGGPYGCAQSANAGVMPGPAGAFFNLSKAINGCMNNALTFWGIPNAKRLAQKAIKRAEAGEIDPISNVKTHRIYLFSGTEDRIVRPPIVAAARNFYEELGVPSSNITKINSIEAGHAFVIEEGVNSCDISQKPYIVDCDYDQAGALLKVMYGSLNPKGAKPEGRLIPFDQRPFAEGLSGHGLANTGFVYVPPACAAGSATCRVHIALHGCGQNHAAVGNAFIKKTGFGPWADTNRLVVLFPQTAPPTFENPQACWDWWGYTGANYLTKSAPQITAIHAMLETLARPRQ